MTIPPVHPKIYHITHVDNLVSIKEGKQAEFLIHDTCPWHLMEKIGVLNEKIRNQVNAILRNVQHKPVVTIERTWYY